jgi:3-methyladenine DNA glycosylase AlkD
MVSVEDVLDDLRKKAKLDAVKGMARYGMSSEKRLGVSIPDIRGLAKKLGKDHSFALELWRTQVPEAMILASMVADPESLTEEQMEDWVKDLNSWDVCDQLCMNLFEKAPLALKKIVDWSKREEEYVKRASFALIACLAWHDKKTDDEVFIMLLETIRNCATDERNYVKKAVNWALRNIGKRNSYLNEVAINFAKEILGIDSKSARWIANRAIKELESEAVQERLKKQSSQH